MIERQVEVATGDGRMGTFICHPERNGPHPVVILFMDAPGIREELRDMARRLAAVGYCVLLPNLYYRERAEEIGPFTGAAWAGAREQVMALMNSLSIEAVMRDTDALLDLAYADAAADAGAVGCVGYCMSGRYALAAALRAPEQVKAAASIYGTRLVTGAPDSPHLLARDARAELYVGCAEHDDYVSLDMVQQIRASLAGRTAAEVELYPGAHHGFAFPQRSVYDRDAAERHWERLFALFARTLQHRTE